MSNETVTYTLESVLKEIKDSIKEVNQKIDTFQQDVNQKFDSLQKDFNQKFDKIDERLTKLEVGQAKLTEKVGEISRCQTQVKNKRFLTHSTHNYAFLNHLFNNRHNATIIPPIKTKGNITTPRKKATIKGYFRVSNCRIA